MADLENLLVKGRKLDREMVTKALKPYLLIDQDTATIRPREGWHKASARTKILAYLLARKAMVVLGLIGEAEEQASPLSIVKATGIPKGTVYPTLKRLYEARPQLVDKDKSSRYSVPLWAVPDVCGLLAGEVEEG